MRQLCPTSATRRALVVVDAMNILACSIFCGGRCSPCSLWVREATLTAPPLHPFLPACLPLRSS